MEKLFKLKAANTTVGVEVRAGLTTFFAMAYIVLLNPVFISATGMDAKGVMVATCISAAVGTLLCAFMSNKPFAMASGMGINAFFAYTLCGTFGYSWQQALAVTFAAGILFLIISILLGSKAITLIPDNLKHAITAGIGAFIALIGIKNSGLIDFSTGNAVIASIYSPQVLTVIAGLVITLVLTVKKVKGNLFIGMLVTVIICLVTGQTQMPESLVSMPTAIGEVAFKLDFSVFTGAGAGFAGILSVVSVIVSMTIVDMFDTLGFLTGVSSQTKLFDEEGGDKKFGRAVMSDALGTIFGALMGVSTVTIYAESASGVEEGGRTGLTSVVTSVCLLLAMFFSPVVGMISSAATAPVLMIVGAIIAMDIKNIDISSLDNALPALIAAITIPVAYSITFGVAMGFIAHIISKVATGKIKEINLSTWITGVIFLLYLFIK